MKIDMTEFVMLAGTDLAVTMIRNRISIHPDMIDDVLDFAEDYCAGMFHVRSEPNSYSYIYFENPVDRDNVVSLCQKISTYADNDSKYH